MAPRYRSGRLFQQFIGVSSYTDDRLVLDVIGNARISGILTVPQLYVTGTAGEITGDLSARNLLITGISTFQGPITAGSSTGSSGQYLQRTDTGVTWASFPAVRSSTYHSATVGQTTFVGNYNAQFVDIYLNGVKLHTSEFTASNGTHVVLTQGCFAEDVVEVVSFNATSMGVGGGLGNGGGALGISTTGTSIFNHIDASGIITAAQFVGDGSQITGLAPPGIGINSGGVQVGAGVTIINFTGAGNTFFYNASNQTLDIDIDSDNFTVPGISTLGTTHLNNLSLTGVSTFGNHIAANGDLDVDGHTELDNLNVSGVSTFAGDAQFNSNVSIAGTLTYEDVKNVDSIGIITARTDLHVGSAITMYGATGIVSAAQFWGDGSNITNIQVPINANNFTDETCYPTFVDSTTGNRPIETDNDFKYNPASNSLTLTVVNANLVGSVSGNVNGNAATSSALSGRPNIDVRAIESTGISVSGIITAGTFSGNVVGDVSATTLGAATIDVIGDAIFRSNVSIAGTLTYEDVKNVDSVGLITARSGIEVAGIVTAKAGAAVTYYGDGSGLVGVIRPSIVTSDNPPSNANDGELWWDSESGVLRVYYQDADSSQWVDASPTSGGAGSIEIINDATPQLGGTLDVSGNDITGTGNINLTGIITSTSLYTGDGTFSGDVDIAGNVSIGGTLTYEDVKNVDSVGIITARDGIDVTGGVITALAGENKIPSLYANMGALPSASSYHGMFAHVHATARGYFAHAGSWFELVNKEADGVVGTGTERYNIGSVDLTDINVSSSSTTSSLNVTGVTTAVTVNINGDLDVDGHTNLDNVSIAGVTTFSSSIGGLFDLDGDLDVDGHTNLDNVNIAGVSTFTGQLNAGAVVASSVTAGSVSIATSAISYTGYGATIGIGTLAPPYGSTLIQDVLELGGNKIHLNASTTWIGGHILPTEHEQFDLGSANRKIRHLFLSDNSIWLGDQNKIDTSTGNMKMKKRHIDSLPKSITDLSGDSSGAISHANTTFGYSPAKTQLKTLTLQDLLSYLTSLDATKTEITDLYPPEMIDGNANSAYTDTDWQKINVDATVGPQNPFVTKGFSSPP